MSWVLWFPSRAAGRGTTSLSRQKRSDEQSAAQTGSLNMIFGRAAQWRAAQFLTQMGSKSRTLGTGPWGSGTGPGRVEAGRCRWWSCCFKVSRVDFFKVFEQLECWSGSSVPDESQKSNRRSYTSSTHCSTAQSVRLCSISVDLDQLPVESNRQQARASASALSGPVRFFPFRCPCIDLY
jgi:hypothetical protein